METRVRRWIAGATGALLVGAALGGCSAKSQPATIDTAYGTGIAVYWSDGTLDALKFPDGSVGVMTDDGKGLAFIHHPNGEVSSYATDGITIEDTWLSDTGGHLADGGSTTKDAMATMGAEFTYASDGGGTTISGTPLGVMKYAPVTAGDPGTCFLTFFQFQVDALSALGSASEVTVFSPAPDYVISGQETFRHELYPAYDNSHFGFCSSDVESAPPWESNFSIAQLGVTYYSAESIYLPKGSSFDGVMLGYWDGPRVYYAPTFIDGPPAISGASGVSPQGGHAPRSQPSESIGAAPQG